MTHQLRLTDNLKSFFDNDRKLIWDMILENRITELLDFLSGNEHPENVLENVLKELFTGSFSETLENQDLTTIRTDCSLLINSLIRVVVALDVNEQYENLLQQVADKVVDSLPGLVKDIRKQANGYPANSINAMVWMEAAGIRSGLGSLIYYYKEKQDLNREHLVTILRTQVTLSIMGHYKEEVGPDMLRAADIKERIGQPDVALNFYNAVKRDFEDELEWFLENPEVGADETERIILSSLKEACLSIDRLTSKSNYEKEIADIEKVLSREYVEEENDEDEE
ncbi:MAG: hypothetical protein LUG18_06145 [Candidatus Azobacteroides sp.]|nr:hypothetical protein [Candidatus Azobacteroides sp.]